jgi:hypothetical protein
MIDNTIFLIVVCLVPWLCYKAAKLDDKEREVAAEQTTKKKQK